MTPKSFGFTFLVALFLSSQAAIAATQCVTDTTTLGTLTVTLSCTAPASQYTLNWDGLQPTLYIQTPSTCTFNFSSPVSGSSVYWKLGAIDLNESYSFQADGNTITGGNITIDNTSTPTAPYGLSVSGNNVVFAGGGSYANGRAVFTGLPSTVNSVAVVAGGTVTPSGLLQMCFDDTAPAPSAVPSLSEWTQFLLALIVIGIAWHFHNNRQNSY